MTSGARGPEAAGPRDAARWRARSPPAGLDRPAEERHAHPPASAIEVIRKERMAIDRVPMPEQDADRAAQLPRGQPGLHPAARHARGRALPAVQEPDVHRRLPGAGQHPALHRAAWREGDLRGAAESLLDDNALPCVTGRVCPQETQCEGLCLRGKKGEPVAIGCARAVRRRLGAGSTATSSRQAAPARAGASGRDRGLRSGRADRRRRAGQARPQGHDLRGVPRRRRRAHLRHPGVPAAQGHRPAGGRPAASSAGVKIEAERDHRQDLDARELREQFDAVFIAVGAGLPVFMDVPGENLKGVYSANEYLTRVNLMGAFRADARHAGPARPARRRRGRRQRGHGRGAHRAAARARTRRSSSTAAASDELPARREEVHHAEEEGVRFELLVAPLEVLGDESGWVTRPALPADGAGRAGRVRPAPARADPGLGVRRSRATWSWWPSAHARTRC